MTLTLVLTTRVTGPALGFPCFSRTWDPTAPSGPWFFPCRLHVLLLRKSLPLSRATRLAGPSGCTSPHWPQAASPGATSPGEGSAGTSHWQSPSDCCSKADVPTKPKNPQGSATVQGSRCFSAELACPPAPPCWAPGAAALASPWKSVRPLEGRSWGCGAAQGHGGVLRGEQPAVSIKGRTPLLVCAPADSQRVLLCLSAVTSAFLSPTSPGAHSQPPRRDGAPPKRSRGRLQRRERGREQQHFQDEQECAPRRAALASSLILYS